jgi:hypothetical protein
LRRVLKERRVVFDWESHDSECVWRKARHTTELRVSEEAKGDMLLLPGVEYTLIMMAPVRSYTASECSFAVFGMELRMGLVARAAICSQEPGYVYPSVRYEPHARCSLGYVRVGRSWKALCYDVIGRSCP